MASMNNRSGEDRDLEEVVRDLADLRPVDGTRLLLYREHPGARLHYVSTFTAESFDLKQIQQRYGGGRFWVFAKRGGKILRRRAVQIEGQPLIRRRGRNSTTTTGSAVGDLIDELAAELRTCRMEVATLKERQEELRRLVGFLVQKGQRCRLPMKTRPRR